MRTVRVEHDRLVTKTGSISIPLSIKRANRDLPRSCAIFCDAQHESARETHCHEAHADACRALAVRSRSYFAGTKKNAVRIPIDARLEPRQSIAPPRSSQGTTLDHARCVTHRQRAFSDAHAARRARTATVQKTLRSKRGALASERSRASVCCYGSRHGACTSMRRVQVASTTMMSSTVDALTDDVSLSASLRAPLSIQEIIRRHHGALIKFLRRRLSIAEDAEDVAQETYIRMMRYEGSTRAPIRRPRCCSASPSTSRTTMGARPSHGAAAPHANR